MSPLFRLVVPLAGALCLTCEAQEPAQASKPAPQPSAERAQEELLAQLGEQGIVVDLKAKTIEIPAVVNQPADLLEYLLIHERGKAHETLFVTEVQPSLLNAALLLLGYENGKNARTEPIEPPPTEEEVAQGADWVKVFPPEGMPLWMTASWKPAEGEPRTVPVEDLVIDLRTGAPVAGNEWIYLGGRVAPLYRGEPPVYVADLEGNLISICYLAPENHLATMKHERARDDQNWWIADGCPPPGTEVTLRFYRQKPKIVAERERKLADRSGDAKAKDEEKPPKK